MKIPDLDNQTIERIVEMAWEDRTSFEAIQAQFGLQEKKADYQPKTWVKNSGNLDKKLLLTLT